MPETPPPPFDRDTAAGRRRLPRALVQRVGDVRARAGDGADPLPAAGDRARGQGQYPAGAGQVGCCFGPSAAAACGASPRRWSTPISARTACARCRLRARLGVPLVTSLRGYEVTRSRSRPAPARAGCPGCAMPCAQRRAAAARHALPRRVGCAAAAGDRPRLSRPSARSPIITASISTAFRPGRAAATLILFVGRLVEKKGVETLLAGLRRSSGGRGPRPRS